MQDPESNTIIQYEESLLEQGRRIRALHEIISRPDLTFEQQIDEILLLGCRLLGTEVGKVGKLDIESNQSEFLNTVVLSDLPARRGIVLPLDKTFCEITFSSPETLAISDVANSNYFEHPAAKFLGMQSYIGCSIKVHGKKFGTVNFSNRTPVNRPFTETDKDLVNLMGSWISVMMERQLEAEELRKSKEAAEQANIAKSAFLANMSHEIRTPLTVIIGFAETALDDEQTDEQRIHALTTIRQSSDHLLNLINDILDFSKIEAGELDLEQTYLYPLQVIAEVESIIIGQAKKKNLDFTTRCEFPLPEQIISDPLRLKQILLNLCSNAIKFTDAGSIQLALQYDADCRVLSFIVSDTGIGMTDEHLDKIFKPFKQADASTTRRFGGSGLGLSLSRRLAENLNGTLNAESAPGKGSVFELAIRVDNLPEGELRLIDNPGDVSYVNSNQADISNMPALSGSVLLVEDNEANQALLKMYLEKMGCVVTIAENGQEALKKVSSRSYELVYMDMQMPVMSGTEALSTLREQGYTAPVVMLTANATLEDRSRCKKAGCDDFLTKPVVRKQLYAMTAAYLPVASSVEHEVLTSQLLEDEPELLDLIVRFVERLPGMVDEITSAFRQQDWSSFYDLVHNLKGTGGNYGFPQLTSLARQLENSHQQSSSQYIAGLLEELQVLVKKITRGIDNRPAE